jgi:hypothetical protein
MMKHATVEMKRRRLLKFGPLVIASVAMTAGAKNVLAQALQSRVDENETKARNIGYRHDVSAVDQAKYPKYQAGTMCSNCQFFKGAPGEPWGPCQVFSGRQVSAKGWCMSYWKQA